MKDYSNLLFKVNYKTKEITKWYICGIKDYKERYYIVAKDNNRNKSKYRTINISLKRFGYDIFSDRKAAEKALENGGRIDCEIDFMCGHSLTVSLKRANVEKKAKELEKSICPLCKNKESERNGCKLVEMPYKEFKRKYPDNDYKYNSYNPEKKTIKVYISVN